jgi:signal transduction histidine kinase
VDTSVRIRLHRRTSLAVLSAIGVALTGVLLFDVYEDWARQGNTLVSTLVEKALPFGLLVGVFYVVWRLATDEYDAPYAEAMAKWALAGTVAMGGLSAWVVGSQLIQGQLKPVIVVLQTTVVGAAAGVVVGHRTATVKRARDENRRKRKRFQSLFDNDPAGIVDLRLADGTLVVEAANPEFQSLFGSAVGEPLADAVGHLGTESLASLREHARTGERYSTEVSAETRDGERHFVIELVPFGSDAVDDPRSYAIYQDVTEIREAEADLERTVEQLARSNEQLQQFAYVASHDLQEPLRMVSSYVDLLESEYGGELDDEADEYIEYAVDGAQRMQAMIDDLLQYSRVHTQADEFEETDPEAVLERVLKDLELLIAERSATVTHDDLPTVVADENQLGQLFQSLLSNAVEHADDGDDPPEVHVSGEERSDAVALSVTDNGPGIPPDQQERVFELFEQSSREDEGTGIGLAICQRIVNRHEGEIWVESDDGKGATFHVELPKRSPKQSTRSGRKG